MVKHIILWQLKDSFTEEEKYCIAMVKMELLEGEKEIHRRLRLK